MGLEGCGYETAPGQGRWLNRDPNGAWGGVNVYGFVGNRPANAVDIYGQSWLGNYFGWVGKGIYDWMMGDNNGHGDPNSYGALRAAELGGIDPHNNALRDTFGVTGQMTGDLTQNLAVGAALGPLAGAAGDALGDLGVPALRGLGKFCGFANNGTVDQYALTALNDGFYPVMVRGFEEPQAGVWLDVGDVWKYGQTQNPATRYSQAFLDEWGLLYQKQFSGTLQEALSAEKNQILNYLYENGVLPPGNKIIR